MENETRDPEKLELVQVMLDVLSALSRLRLVSESSGPERERLLALADDKIVAANKRMTELVGIDVRKLHGEKEAVITLI